jgi:hypothetical protein
MSHVSPAVTTGQLRTMKVSAHVHAKSGLDGATGKNSVGTSRKDGQDRAPPHL